MKKLLNLESTNRLAWVVLLVCIIYLGIGWFLYPTFRMGGKSIYWLLTIFTVTVLPFIGLCFLLWIISCFGWLMQTANEKRRLWSKYTIVSFLAALAILVSSFPFMLGGFVRHLESLSTGNHVYYLSEVYPPGDVNFQLHECDFLGLRCEVVYRSYDFSERYERQAYLEFDKTEKSVNVIFRPTQEILYSRHVP